MSSHTLFRLQIDHERPLIRRLPSSNHLVDGVASVVGHLGHVDSQHGAGEVGERLVLHAFKNLYMKEEALVLLPIDPMCAACSTAYKIQNTIQQN